MEGEKRDGVVVGGVGVAAAAAVLSIFYVLIFFKIQIKEIKKITVR